MILYSSCEEAALFQANDSVNTLNFDGRILKSIEPDFKIEDKSIENQEKISSYRFKAIFENGNGVENEHMLKLFPVKSYIPQLNRHLSSKDYKQILADVSGLFVARSIEGDGFLFGGYFIDAELKSSAVTEKVVGTRIPNYDCMTVHDETCYYTDWYQIIDGVQHYIGTTNDGCVATVYEICGVGGGNVYYSNEFAGSVVIPPPSGNETIIDEESLNSCELLLGLSQPGNLALNIGNAAIAEYQTVIFFNKHHDHTCSNAFLHAYWNALNVRVMGPLNAILWGNAHECNGTAMHNTMGYFNNNVGRMISIRNPLVSTNELAHLVLDAVLAGETKEIEVIDGIQTLVDCD